MTSLPDTPLLDTVKLPADLRTIDDRDLPQLARELRDEMIDAVSKTGGHLGAGLGVVELTIAIHKVFNTPDDRLIFDVGHQCYPHKILTGRRDRIRTLRQEDGLSGFTKRIRSLWRCAFVHFDFRRSRHGRGRRPVADRPQGDRGDRRWRDVGWHGL